jgi:inositol oxygenase
VRRAAGQDGDGHLGCIELLNEFIDDSDPDLDTPQIEHLLQTAEAIRKDHPDEDWLHLTGLIHGN